MATQLVYLDGFDIVTCRARIIAAEKTEDQRIDVQLDKTCFYPRGGGQDWDTGVIESADGTVVVKVWEVRLDENGLVHHIGAYQAGEFHADDDVSCAADTERRTINTLLHSAGHVVDLAVDRLKFPWKPGRGGHYPHMSFVEYAAEITSDEAENARQQIERIANEAIAKGSRNEVRFMPVSEMHTVCRNIPANIPTNKPARVVIYSSDFGVPCGGTHVADIHDIGKITITKIKSKKGVTKVSYAVEGIN